MTQYQLILASPTLGLLNSFKLPIKTAYSLYNLNKKIAEYRDFFIEQERKLVEEFNGIVKENGQVSFEEAEDSIKFAQKYAELKSLEAAGFEAVKINMADLGDQTLTVADIAALDGIIEFID